MKTLRLVGVVKSILLLGMFLTTSAYAVPPSLPDFVIESLSIAPTNAVEGIPITVTVTVKNQGDAAGDGRYLDVWFNTTNSSPVFGDVGDWWTAVGSLAPGASRTIVSPPVYVKSEGTNQLFACIEFEDFVSEKNNTNNCFSLGFDAAPVSSLLLPVHRFWSPKFRGHFYTISEGEKDNIIANLSQDWGYESIAYYTYNAAVIGTVPVYRFWSARYRGHFYTISESEKDNIIANLSRDWTYEGIAYYAYSTVVPDSMPVYRFWSSRYQHHFYTISEPEKDNIITNLSQDWSYEGIAYYAFTTESFNALDGFYVPETGNDATAKIEETAEPSSFTPEFTKVASEGDAVDSGTAGIQSAIASDPVDIIFPLYYPGREVMAYVYDSVADAWHCVLSATNSPESVVLKNILSDRSYLLEVFADDPADREMVSVHKSWFEMQLDAPAQLNGRSQPTSNEDGVGSPVVRIKMPFMDDTLTVKLYSAAQGVVTTLTDVLGEETVDLPISEGNRWYWISGWRDSDNALVLSIWLRHEIEE